MGSLGGGLFKVDDALENGQGAEIDRFDAVEGEAGGAEIFGLGIGGIGGVVDDANVKRGAVEVDNGVAGGLLIIGSFGNGIEVRGGFHFNDSEVVLGVGVDKALIFKKGTDDGDGFLVG